MAFTGVPVLEQISDRCVRITGVSLAALASGSLGLFNTTVPNAVPLPDAFNPKPYDYQASLISIVESVRVTVNPNGAAQAATVVPVRVVKTGSGVGFSIAFTNDDAVAATSALEIYVEFRD
jgi:hypothetical protein